ncbi:hypothetical protein BST97_13095 [Nonlabens spongiae]|uniref:Uncharacterized protein n=1 Tax=Nonlabens spongiae TaxID=331648 RepID=A0A1W6MMZ1_9FLAO|nr:hypothetical protein BST97_13095 [Nonlabens spongiae]
MVSDTVDQVDLVYDKVSEALRFRESEPELDISAMENSYDSLRFLVHRWKGDDSKFYSILFWTVSTTVSPFNIMQAIM